MTNSSGIENKRILFVVHTETSFKELFRVAKFLKRAEFFEPVFYFYKEHHSLERMRSECVNAGILCFSSDSGKMNASHAKKKENGGQKTDSRTLKIKKIIYKMSPSFFLEILVAVNFLLIQLRLNRYNHEVMARFSPAIVVVPEDGLDGNLSLICLAKIKDIPVVDIPYEYSTKKQVVEAIKSSRDYQRFFGYNNFFNRLVGRLFPQWVYKYNGESLLRENPLIILLLEALRLAPGVPWTVHGGHADSIAVESYKMREHYLNEGVPPEKLVLTGTMADDHLFETISRRDFLRRELCLAHGLEGDKKLVVCAIPTDYTSRIGCEFKNYEEMIDFWVESLMQLKGVNVILQLHPAVTAEQERYIRSKYLVISKINIASLIPLCDIFVTSVSSVIRMAIVCKVPVVNYDVYKFGYKDYEDATGVITMSSREEFVSILAELVSNREFYDSVVERHSRYSGEWGFLDGKSGERILGLFDASLSGKKGTAEK